MVESVRSGGMSRGRLTSQGCRTSGSWSVRGMALVVRSVQSPQHGLTRLRKRDCVVLRDLVQQNLQKLRGSPVEHDAVTAFPGRADGADLGPVGFNVVGEPVEPLFSNLLSGMSCLHNRRLLSRLN